MAKDSPLIWGRDEVRRTMKAYREYSALYLTMLEKWELEIPSNADISISVGSAALNGVLIKFGNIKDMLPIMEFIENLCTAMKCKVKSVEDFAEIQRRSFRLTIPIYVNVFFDNSGDSCRFIKKGKEEKDVYEFVCPESSIK